MGNTIVVRRAGKPSRLIVGIFLFITVGLLILFAIALLAAR
jgi:hypothetical protein